MLRLRAEGLEWRELDGEVVALDVERYEYFGLNRSGSVLWQAVSGGSSRSALIDLIVERYGLDEATAGGHVDAFVADLGRRGLLDSP
jgi:hypothetical protein